MAYTINNGAGRKVYLDQFLSPCIQNLLKLDQRYFKTGNTGTAKVKQRM